MNFALTSQFAENIRKQADLHRINRLTLVGAEAEDERYGSLSMNDRAIVRIFASTMADLKIPMSGDLVKAACDCLHHLLPESFEVVNLVYGRRDFREHNQPADAVVFCNLPLDNPARPGPTHEQLPQWRDALERSGAKVAWISGSDSFTPEDVKGSRYIPLKMAMSGQSFLIHRDYFESLNEYIHWSASPLEHMVRPYLQNADQAFLVSPDYSARTGDYKGLTIRPF